MKARFSHFLAAFVLAFAVSGVALARDNSVTPGDKPDTSKVGYLRPQKQAKSGPETEVGSARQDVSPFRVAVALALLGGLAGTALWLKRRQRGELKATEGLALCTVSTIMLPGKSHVTLVSVGGEALLLGSSEAGMTLLRTYSKSELDSLAATGDHPEGAATSAAPAPAPAPGATKTAAGARLAFREILENAAHSEAKSRAENARRYAESLQHAGLDSDDAVPDSGPRHRDEDDEMPPHLALALSESQGRDAFGEPEGQAAELMRRFRERKS